MRVLTEDEADPDNSSRIVAARPPRTRAPTPAALRDSPRHAIARRMTEVRPDPAPQTPATAAPPDLAAEIAALRAEVARLNAHRFVRDLNSPLRMLAHQFVRGLALGLGTVVGASILVSVSVYLLSQVDFIPILGDWAAEIAREIEAGR
jgi:hypothetical protein